MKINAIQNQNFNNSNNIAFGILWIKIKGTVFKNNPENIKLIKNTIQENETIRSFLAIITAKLLSHPARK